MKKPPKKLRLATDTVRTLTAAQLEDVAAGCDTGSITTEVPVRK